MKKYENYDLSMFRLNEAGEPLVNTFLYEWHRLHRGGPDALAQISAFCALYHLPFDPSEHLIGERRLFEGWKKGRFPNNLFLTENGTKSVHFNIEMMGLKVGALYQRNGVPQGDYKTPPQTVAHFIDDCARAEIMLVWSPYAVGLLTGKEDTNG